MRIDPAELDPVILNLMANSLYWMSRHKGKHRLRFRVAPGPTAGRVTVSIDDTGPGIDVRDRELVFRPGWTRKPGGIGMGLVVASELVEDHGGKMRTSVPGELGGATFGFDLPLVDGGTGDSPLSSAVRILVIDDEARVRSALESELEEDKGPGEDGTVWEVRGQGFDGVKDALVRFRPDMVILDLVEGGDSQRQRLGQPII